jgi:site-specific DNA-cytosine methylase
MGLYLVPTIAPDSMYTIKLKGGYKFNVRRAFVEECERLQTFPDNYTKTGRREDGSTYNIPKGIRYKTLGNAFTVAVIKHLLQNSLK